ncbi:restriction endonuclease subunit S [Bacillus cereus]
MNCKSGDSLDTSLIEKEAQRSTHNIPVIGGNGIMGYSACSNIKNETISIGRVGALCGNVHYIDYKCWITDNSLFINRFKKESIDLKFFSYVLEQLNLNQFSTSTAQPLITGETIKRRKIALPPLSEQKKIVSYIQSKVAGIDALIMNKEKMLNLFEEKRQTMITEAVTKGLNPNVKMKDSGVEWIGEIPEYWNIKKMKYLAQGKMMYGANESAELDDRTLPRYIRITDIDQRGQLKEDTFKSLSKEVAAQYPVIKGDILFARSGATVGKTYHHDSEKIASFAGYLIRLRARKEYNSKYLYYYTQSSIYKEWIQSILIQATIQNVSAEKYADLLITIPSLKEMNQIVEYLERIDANIYSSLSLVTEQIQKLKDYRQSLIYEAVTGKIDVRDFEVKA